MTLFFIMTGVTMSLFFIGQEVGFIKGKHSVYKKLREEARQVRRLSKQLNYLKKQREQRHD